MTEDEARAAFWRYVARTTDHGRNNKPLSVRALAERFCRDLAPETDPLALARWWVRVC